jgi:DNA-binding MarR family transcriptional regulator
VGTVGPVDDAGAPLVASIDDVGLLCQVVAAATSERILRDLAAAGYPDVRPSHGYVVQGVLAGDTTVTQLAHRLGVTVQAVSKSVAELEDAGYLERRRDEHDGRTRRIALTRRGRAMVATSRRSRSAAADEVVGVLGERDTRTLVRLLQRVVERHGGLDDLAARRLRPVGGLE